LPENHHNPENGIINISDQAIDDEADSRQGMSLGDHINELRFRLIRVILAVSAVFVFCMIFYKSVWKWALYPREVTAQILDKKPEDVVPLQFLTPWDGLSSVAGLSIKLALLVALPIILAEIWLFVIPGLRHSEKRALGFILSAGSVLSITGALIAFFYAAPVGLAFLTEFNHSLEGTVTTFTAKSYFGFISMACLGFALAFETPLVMMALTWTGLITPQSISKYWRHSVLAISIIGALFTPPDPATMLMLAGCLLVLYFLGYLLSRAVYNKNKKIDGELSEIGEE